MLWVSKAGLFSLEKRKKDQRYTYPSRNCTLLGKLLSLCTYQINKAAIPDEMTDTQLLLFIQIAISLHVSRQDECLWQSYLILFSMDQMWTVGGWPTLAVSAFHQCLEIHQLSWKKPLTIYCMFPGTSCLLKHITCGLMPCDLVTHLSTYFCLSVCLRYF